MRPPSRSARLALASVAVALPLLTAGCSSEETPIRGENGAGVDSKASQPPGTDSDQGGSNGGSGATQDPKAG